MCLKETQCPECESFDDVEALELRRREFLKVGGAAALATIGTATINTVTPSVSKAEDAPAAASKPTKKPAEGLIRELHASFTPEQKKELVLPWDHARGNGKLSRLGTYNSAILNKRLHEHCTQSQQDLVKRIVQSILSGNEAWERITRHGRWDGSKSFDNTGCVIFGEPSDDKKFAWVFSGHHLTLRCDGNSEPGAAFGGPIYYGHSPNGYTDRNVYHYQTKQVQAVFDALDAKQQEKAIAAGSPGDRERGIRFPEPGAPQPGIAYAELAKDQQGLVESVMRTLLNPFRKEDTDEVMEIVKAGGGMEKIHLAFYKDRSSTEENVRWHFWRLEGPGFIWNYRVLPHVHCYVNITSQV